MKARLENGQIIRYHRIPKTFLTILEYLPTIEGHNLDEDGNPTPYIERQGVWKADQLTDDELKLFGFFDLMQEDYDSRIQQLSEPVFDDSNEVFNQYAVDIDFPYTLEECKERVISSYDSLLHAEFLKTDYHYIKKMELGTDIPQDVLDYRAELRLKAKEVKLEIMSLSTKKQVFTYDLPNYMFLDYGSTK